MVRIFKLLIIRRIKDFMRIPAVVAGLIKVGPSLVVIQ